MAVIVSYKMTKVLLSSKVRKVNKTILLFFCCLLHATEHHVQVSPGDSFNTILRKSNISSHSINTINAQAADLKPLGSLKPNDTIKLSINDESRKLVSATIQTKTTKIQLLIATHASHVRLVPGLSARLELGC